MRTIVLISVSALAVHVAAGAGEYDWKSRRDPFEYTRIQRSREPVPRRLIDPPIHVPDPPRTPEKTADRARAEADAVISAADGLLADRRFDLLIENARSGLESLHRFGLDVDQRGERLRQIMATARRMRHRYNVEKRIAGMKLVVGGIIRTPDSAVAMVNDTMVEEGDLVSGVQVVGIERDAIIVEHDGVRVRIAQ